MQTELSFILFMLLICSIAVLYLYLIARSNRKTVRTVFSSPSEKSPSVWAIALASTTTISSGSQHVKAGSVNHSNIRRRQNFKKKQL